MQRPIKDNGIYILEILVDQHLNIQHNKFSGSNFNKGYYYYVGSAQRNISKRIERHLRKFKNIHWHIDYLTTAKHSVIKNVYIIYDLDKNHECTLVKKLIEESNLSTPVKGFGNSDCSQCKSHLLYSKAPLTYNQLLALYHSTVLFIPSSKDINCL